MLSEKDKQVLYFDGFLALNVERYESQIWSMFPESVGDESSMWNEKYPGVFDLVSCDKTLIINSLLVNHVMSFLGSGFVVSNIQLRKVLRSHKSYMFWHRDTFAYCGQVEGEAPPGYKLILYRPGTLLCDSVQVLKGSHRLYTGRKVVDFLLSRLFCALVRGHRAVLLSVDCWHNVPRSRAAYTDRVIITFSRVGM